MKQLLQPGVRVWVLVGLLLVVAGASWAQAAKSTLAAGESNKAFVTIDVKDTDISRVLDAFSQQTGLSVVVGKEVAAAISVRLVNVAWDEALEAILKPYGFGYQRTGNIIIVLPLDKLAATSQTEPLVSKVFSLKYLDAGDLKPVVDAQLSSRGKSQVLEITGQKGWEFGAFGAAGSGAQASRSSVGGTANPRRYYKGAEERRSKSRQLIVTDIPSVLERVASVVAAVDVMPQQILIQSRFMEVNRDRLRDLGVDFGTGSGGATTAAVETIPTDKNDATGNPITGVGLQSIGSLVAPSAFGAKSSAIDSTSPFDTGLSLAFKKFTGSQFDILLHALEEDVHTNTLSAPSIMTLDNQEANILVGTQFPILTSSVAGTTSTTTVSSLDYYQDIGVQLRVVPQIAGEAHINMIVHPAVTSIAERITAQGTGGVTVAQYPIITTREAETQILMKNGETVMIGGMYQDVKTTGFHKVPILADIPIIGAAFKRQTNDIAKIDLLIFITATIVNDKQVATQEPAFMPGQPGPDTTIEWKAPAASEQPAEAPRTG